MTLKQSEDASARGEQRARWQVGRLVVRYTEPANWCGSCELDLGCAALMGHPGNAGSPAAMALVGILAGVEALHGLCDTSDPQGALLILQRLTEVAGGLDAPGGDPCARSVLFVERLQTNLAWCTRYGVTTGDSLVPMTREAVRGGRAFEACAISAACDWLARNHTLLPPARWPYADAQGAGEEREGGAPAPGKPERARLARLVADLVVAGGMAVPGPEGAGRALGNALREFEPTKAGAILLTAIDTSLKIAFAHVADSRAVVARGAANGVQALGAQTLAWCLDGLGQTCSNAAVRSGALLEDNCLLLRGNKVTVHGASLAHRGLMACAAFMDMLRAGMGGWGDEDWARLGPGIERASMAVGAAGLALAETTAYAGQCTRVSELARAVAGMARAHAGRVALAEGAGAPRGRRRG